MLRSAHLMGKIMLGVGNSESGMSTSIFPTTLKLALIVFFFIRILSLLKVPLNQYRATVGTFINRNY